MPRRVVIAACNFPPDASVGTMRTLRLARHLAGSGWNVDVVTIAPDAFRPGTVVDAALLDKVPASVNVIRADAVRPFARLTSALRPARPSGIGEGSSAAPPPRSGAPAPGRLSTLKRAVSAALALPDREVGWLTPAVLRGWRQFRRHPADVVYSSGPPFTAHFVGFFLSRLTGRPWVADFRDPWARAPWREGRFAFEKRAWAVLERFVVTRARRVVFVTDTNFRDFAEAYGPAVAARFVVIPNGCDASEFEGLARQPRAVNGPFVLLHAGSLYGARNPAALIRALANAVAKGAVDPARFRLRFIGRVGIAGADLPGLARQMGLADVVEFVNHLPRRACLQEMVDASALLIVQPVTTVSIPAKLYEYLAAGKPILALAEPGGETAELVGRSGAGVAVAADDEVAVEHALVSIVRAAAGAFPPADRSLYDGAIRAAELEQVLVEATGSQP